MRTTISLDDDLVAAAQEYTGPTEKSALIDHIRRPDPAPVRLLDAGRAIAHPGALGGIALGSVASRRTVMPQLDRLKGAVVAFQADVLAFIERHALAGTGVGDGDADLSASARITPRGRPWTRDRRLKVAAARLDVAWPEG